MDENHRRTPAFTRFFPGTTGDPVMDTILNNSHLSKPTQMKTGGKNLLEGDGGEKRDRS